MAHIHDTTMSPTKLELLEPWLRKQRWYAGPGQPDLTKVGGFRLDDPEGEVGIEFMFVRDDADGDGTTYHVPMTYRGAPLDSAEDALIGNGEHGVLGRRWIYDGAHDPVLMAQVVALLQGKAVPQHQSESDTVDPTVHVVNAVSADAERAATADRIRLLRVLGVDAPLDGATCVMAGWRMAGGADARGPVITLD
jgi:hypothetical protein